MKKDEKTKSKNVVDDDVEVVDLELLKEVLGGLAGAGLPDLRPGAAAPRYQVPSENDTWQ